MKLYFCLFLRMFLQRPRTGGKKDATKLLLTALLSSVSSRHLVGVVSFVE